MKQVQMFYDYRCPFCMEGYEKLMRLIPSYPEIEIDWRPVQINPGPMEDLADSDLCLSGFYATRDLGADIQKYHMLIYRAIFVERRYTDDVSNLSEIMADLADSQKFGELLKSGKYIPQIMENNELAYEKEGIWYIPSFRAGKLKLDAKGGFGVSVDELRTFFDKVMVS